MQHNRANHTMPLLSICIPTYNRANYLEKTIINIIEQEIFINSNYIEIVISDNCSTDNTKEIVLKYLRAFPNKIIYNRNDKNIYDANFEKVLLLGHGIFLKLHNDTLLFNNNMLERYLQFIVDNAANRPVLFFTNGSALTNKDYIYCNSLNLFIKYGLYYITWIGGFGIWQKDINILNKCRNYSKTHFLQVKVLMELVNDKNQAIINNEHFFNLQLIKNKSKYDIFDIFISNLFPIYREYVNNNTISKETFSYFKKHILFGFIIPSLLNFDNSTETSLKHNWKILFKEYKFCWYLYLSPIVLFVDYIYLKYKYLFSNLPQSIKIFLKVIFK